MTQASWPPPDQRWIAPVRARPRRRSLIRVLLLAAVIGLGAVVLVLVVVQTVGRQRAGAEPSTAATQSAGSATRAPTSSAPTAPTSGRPVPSRTTTAAATPAPPVSSVTPPTEPVTPQPGELPGPRGVGSPDPRPGALPQPVTIAQAWRWLADNAVYERRVAVPTRCGLPLIDPRSITAAALGRHLTRSAGCLTMVWRPPVSAAGFAMPYPVVQVYSGPVSSPCGRLDTYNAYYCSANQRIYFGRLLHQILPRRDFGYDLILAHEYGHAVQGRTGIFPAGFVVRYNTTGMARQNELMRRLELQADCFAGTAMRALAGISGLTASDRRGFADVLTSIADDTLTGTIQQHGSAKARSRWLAAGLGSSTVSACRTFSAAADAVR